MMNMTPSCDRCVRGWARRLPLLLGVLAVTLASASVEAGPLQREQAYRLHKRLTGVPPTEAVLLDMETDLNVGTETGDLSAAQRAMQDPHFYTVTLKNFAAPWTNRDQSSFVPLNDYTTLVIGMVKDDIPFDGILSADLLYVGSGQALPTADGNGHYETLEQRMLAPGFDPQSQIVATTQSSVYGLPPSATAGARRIFRFTS